MQLKIDDGSLSYKTIQKFQNSGCCEGKTQKCNKCKNATQQCYFIDYSKAIQVSEELRSNNSLSPKQNKIEKISSWGKHQISPRERSKGISPKEYKELYFKEQGFEKAQLAIDGKLSNQFTFQPSIDFLREFSGSKESSVLNPIQEITKLTQPSLEKVKNDMISTKKNTDLLPSASLTPVLSQLSQQHPNIHFQKRASQKEDYFFDETKKGYQSKEPKQFIISNYKGIKKGQILQKLEMKTTTNKQKMPFNHFQHPLHYQYPMKYDTNNNKEKERTKKVEIKESEMTSDSITKECQSIKQGSTHIENEIETHQRFQNLSIQQRIHNQLEKRETQVYVLVNSREQTEFMDTQLGSAQENELSPTDLKRVSFLADNDNIQNKIKYEANQLLQANKKFFTPTNYREQTNSRYQIVDESPQYFLDPVMKQSNDNTFQTQGIEFRKQQKEQEKKQIEEKKRILKLLDEQHQRNFKLDTGQVQSSLRKVEQISERSSKLEKEKDHNQSLEEDENKNREQIIRQQNKDLEIVKVSSPDIPIKIDVDNFTSDTEEINDPEASKLNQSVADSPDIRQRINEFDQTQTIFMNAEINGQNKDKSVERIPEGNLNSQRNQVSTIITKLKNDNGSNNLVQNQFGLISERNNTQLDSGLEEIPYSVDVEVNVKAAKIDPIEKEHFDKVFEYMSRENLIDIQKSNYLNTSLVVNFDSSTQYLAIQGQEISIHHNPLPNINKSRLNKYCKKQQINDAEQNTSRTENKNEVNHKITLAAPKVEIKSASQAAGVEEGSVIQINKLSEQSRDSLPTEISRKQIEVNLLNFGWDKHHNFITNKAVGIIDKMKGNELIKYQIEHTSLKDDIFLNDTNTINKKISADIYYQQRQIANEEIYIDYLKKKVTKQNDQYSEINQKKRKQLIQNGQLLEDDCEEKIKKDLVIKQEENKIQKPIFRVPDFTTQKIQESFISGEFSNVSNRQSISQPPVNQSDFNTHNSVVRSNQGLINRNNICFSNQLQFKNTRLTRQDLRRSMQSNDLMKQLKTEYMNKQLNSNIKFQEDERQQEEMASISKSYGPDIWKSQIRGIRQSVDTVVYSKEQVKRTDSLSIQKNNNFIPPRTAETKRNSQHMYQSDGFTFVPNQDKVFTYDSQRVPINSEQSTSINASKHFKNKTFTGSIKEQFEVKSHNKTNNNDYLDFLSNKTSLLPKIALKHKIDQDRNKRPMEQKSEIEPNSFDISLYNSRVSRKQNPEHPLFDKHRNDQDFSMHGDEFKDIQTQIINDRYPMAKRTSYNNEITTQDILSGMNNLELDFLGYPIQQDSLPVSYRSYEAQLIMNNQNNNQEDNSDQQKQDLPLDTVIQNPDIKNSRVVSTFQSNHLNSFDGNNIQTLMKTIDEKDRQILNKLPMYQIGRTFSPKLKMKAHMKSFKTIKHSEMIRSFQKNNDQGIILGLVKEKKRAKVVQQDQKFQLSIFKDCLDKMDI